VGFVDIIRAERSWTVVKTISRRLCLALVTMGMLGVMGCGEDNESAGAKASEKLGDAGTADAKGLPAETITQPKTEAERGKMGAQGSQIMQGKKDAK
jgi:hypothetical protein